MLIVPWTACGQWVRSMAKVIVNVLTTICHLPMLYTCWHVTPLQQYMPNKCEVAIFKVVTAGDLSDCFRKKQFTLVSFTSYVVVEVILQFLHNPPFESNRLRFFSFYLPHKTGNTWFLHPTAANVTHALINEMNMFSQVSVYSVIRSLSKNLTNHFQSQIC